VLLISFDGFRADYLSKTDTPNFDKLVKNGVISEGLIPVFPTKTFPNHYAIATGLYPENNKLISNNMYDPEMDLRYSIGNREQVENPDWYGGEPIWNTVEKAGLHAGTMFWVGSEAPIQDMRPTFWKTYDGRMDRKARIDSVLKWMSLGTEKEVDLGTLYYSVVDSRGHRYGPDSDEVIEAIELADSLVGYMIDEMKAKRLWENTNIIIVSDHGMAEVSRERIIVLDDYFDTDQIEIIEGSPSLMMNVTSGEVDDIYESLKAGEEHYKVFRKNDLPERFHLKNSSRVPDIIVIPEIGYTVNTREYFERRPDYPSGGAHGFDNEDEEMHAIFIAHGPGFKKGMGIPAFENIHVFELITHLLGIESSGTDGNLETVREILN
jgi:predicted AlkP superfamily pyrophosphatase or phosphodiesterase